MSDDDTKPSVMPEQPTTVQLAQVPDWAIELTKSVKVGFLEVRSDLEAVKAEGQRANLRLTRQEVRMDDVETRLANNSMRVKADTAQDQDHAAKLANALLELADEKKKRETLEANAATKDDLKLIADAQTTAIVSSLQKAASDPWVRRIGIACAGLVLVILNALTVYVTRPPQPAPPVPHEPAR